MTPPAATPAARSHVRPSRAVAPRTARRPSGPGRTPARASRGAGEKAPAHPVLAPPLGLRLVRRVVALPDARLLDRLVRGRLWIGLLAAGLVGVVFLQISLLELNTGISRAVQTEQTLERQNTALKLDLSRLTGGERVLKSAAAMGFVAPAAGQPRFLDAGKSSAVRAAANITAPAPIQQLPLGMIPPAEGGTAGVTAPPGAPAEAAPGAAVAASTAPRAAAEPLATAPTQPAAPPAATGGLVAAGQG